VSHAKAPATTTAKVHGAAAQKSVKPGSGGSEAVRHTSAKAPAASHKAAEKVVKATKTVKSPAAHNPSPAAVRPGPARPGGLSAAAAPQKHATEGYVKDERFLASQRAALLRERSTYLEQAAALKAEAESLVEEMEPGDIQFDDESGEGGTVTVDRERDLALSAQAMAAVEEIDHTLAKMDNGTYGICENCGRLIPKARLEALPYARLCIDCKSGGLSRR